jgi:hypothetical protein
MPSFASNEWMDKQVNRIHDLTDINLLRMAKEGMDATYKTMVWNLSQNCDRDTMGKVRWRISFLVQAGVRDRVT